MCSTYHWASSDAILVNTVHTHVTIVLIGSVQAGIQSSCCGTLQSDVGIILVVIEQLVSCTFYIVDETWTRHEANM